MKKTINNIIETLGYDIKRKKMEYPNLKSRHYLSEAKHSSVTNDPFNNSPDTIKAHMFWAYGNLSRLEILCADSFLRNGYDLYFWTYDTISNLPTGAIQKDAREILPESRVFKYKNGSYAGFANLFRYAVLIEKGGLWADTDVICLLPMAELLSLGQHGFLVTQRTKKSLDINNNLIYYPEHTEGSLIDLAFAITDRFDVDKLNWGDCGPKLLTSLAKTYPSLTPTLMEPNFANPINPWECPNKLLQAETIDEIPDSWGFLHCYNEMWRKRGKDKNAPFPSESILAKIESLY